MLDRLGTENRRYVVDISVRDQVGAMAAEVEGEFGGLDVLINNAGVFVWADFADTTLQHELEPHNINVTLVCPGNIRTPIIDHIVVRGYDRDRLTRLSFGMMPRMAPDKAADIILRGMKKDRALIILTPSAHLMYLVKRLSNNLYRVMLGRSMRWIYERMR